MNKEKNKKINNNKKVVLITLIVISIILLILGNWFYNINKIDRITKVKRLLPSKYYEISCVDSTCNEVVAYSGNKKGKSTVLIISSTGKKYAKYSIEYDKSSTHKIYKATSKYIIVANKDSNNKTKGYSLLDSKGKELYNTKNTLDSINDNLVEMVEIKNDKKVYSIFNNKGKELYSNISDIKLYNNGKIVSMINNGEKLIIDENGETILNDYTIEEEIKNDSNEVLFLIVTDKLKNSFYYFNIKNNEIVGDSFQYYTKSDKEGELLITKNENNKITKYKLSVDGTQKIIEESKSQLELVTSIKKKLKNNYTLYSSSVYNDKQTAVLVDNREKSSFGIYDLKNNKYSELYKYGKEKAYISSSVNELKSNDNNKYLQITCSVNSCDKSMLIIYDVFNAKVLYSMSDSALKAQRYIQYENNYKVIRYSYSSSNEKYKGKYVLYDNNNKELLVSNNQIVIVDSKKILGEEISTQSLVLYSSNRSSQINPSDKYGVKLNISNQELYKYSDGKYTYIINNKGQEVIKAKDNSSLTYSNDSILYLDGSKIVTYNVKSKKTSSYKLKKNEKINDDSGKSVAPYRNTMFINNSVDKYIKVVNINGHTIKKIRKSEIYSVNQSEKTNNVFIITKKIDKSNNVYGLYLGK